MSNITSLSGEARYCNSVNSILNRKYLQSIILTGTACKYFLDNNAYFKINTPSGRGLEMLGAGTYFVPYITDEIECRCLKLWDDLPEKYKPAFGICDLTPIVEFLKSGGAYE